jgi:hypothetical protein
MAEVLHVGRHGLVVPAAAAEQEAPLGQERGRAQEELLDARFAVGQPVAEKAQVAGEARIGLDGMVGARDRARCRSGTQSRAPRPR